MRLRKLWVYGIGFVLAASVAACGGGSKSASSTSAAPAAAAGGGGKKVDAATAGEMKGTVALDGVAPKNADIKMNADPVCVKQTAGSPQSQETFIVGKDGKSLANVFVYVKDGLGNYSFDVPTESAKIDQQNAATIRTCSACASARRSKSSTAIRPCTTSTRCRRPTPSSTTASRSRA